MPAPRSETLAPRPKPGTGVLHHPAHAAHVGHATAAAAVLLGSVHDDRLRGEDVLRDRGCVLQRRARHHGRIDDAVLDEILDLTGVDVQALALLGRANLVHDDRALEARVVGELPERLLERAEDDVRPRLLVALEELEALLDRVGRVQQRDAATRDDALLESRAGCLQRVLDPVLLLLHLRLGGCADLDHCNAAGELRQPLLQLLAVEVRVGVLDLALDLLDAGLDRLAVAGTVDDRGRILVDDDLAGAAELRQLRVLELEAELLGDDLAAGEHGDVLEHPLAAVAEAGCLDRNGGEDATELVDDDRRKRLTLEVLGDDDERLAGLDDLLENRQQILDRTDLLVRDQDVRVVEHGLHAIGVRDHVRGQVALVELHALRELEVEAEGLPLLDVDDAILADLLDRVGDDVADLALARRDGGDTGDVFLARDLGRLLLEVVDHCADGLLDAALETHRVRAGRNVLETLADDRLCEHGRRRRAVTGNVVRGGRDLADELGTL